MTTAPTKPGTAPVEHGPNYTSLALYTTLWAMEMRLDESKASQKESSQDPDGGPRIVLKPELVPDNSTGFRVKIVPPRCTPEEDRARLVDLFRWLLSLEDRKSEESK